MSGVNRGSLLQPLQPLSLIMDKLIKDGSDQERHSLGYMWTWAGHWADCHCSFQIHIGNSGESSPTSTRAQVHCLPSVHSVLSDDSLAQGPNSEKAGALGGLKGTGQAWR